MPLINTSVTNMIQGVSQQPDSSRFAGQCDEQENALSSVVDGLKKRPNTKHVVRMLSTAISNNSFVHFINRDDDEKYVVFLDKATDKLRAYNAVSGVAATINGATSVDIPSTHYLHTADPSTEIKGLTVADNTFLLNTQTDVAELTTYSPALPRDAITAITQGDYEKRYEIEIGRSNFPSVIFWWGLWGNGDGRLYHFDIINNGFGVASYQYLMGNGQNTGFVPTFDTEGRMTGGSLTVSTNYRWPAWKLQGRNTPVTYMTGVTPVHESHYSRLSVISGAATAGGQNADTNVLAQNFVQLSSVNGIAPPKVVGMTGDISKSGGNNVVANFDTSAVGHVIRHKWKASVNDSVDFTIKCHDPLGGFGLSTVYKEVSSISALPLIAPDGFKVKVVGDADISQDDYYVRFTTQDQSVFGAGTWSETIGSLVPLGLDASTMPMKLENSGLNAFILEEFTFDDRTVGDVETNPPPSFVNKKINNLMFFKNRLGFLTNDSVIFSEAGKFFNFYRTTVTSLLDSAPIDVAVSSTRVTKLTAAVGFQENLLIFGDNVQFVLKGGDLLTPKTVSVSPVTNFSFDTHDTPLVLGSYVYFPFTRGLYTGVREYTVNATTDTYDSAEITEHTPAYIPQTIISAAGTTSENAYAVVSLNEPEAVYFYKYFWENNAKVLSSWSKFKVDGEIRGLEFLGSDLNLVVVREGQTHLLKMSINSGQQTEDAYVSNTATSFGNLKVLLDNRIEMRRNTNNRLEWYNGSTWTSNSSTLPYDIDAADIADYRFVTSTGQAQAVTYSAYSGFFGTGSTPSSPVYGYFGRLYNMKYKFSTQLFKAAAGKSSSPSAASALTIRNGALFYDETSTFDVKVEIDQRNAKVCTYQASDQPNSSTANGVKFGDGFFKFAVHGRAKDTAMTIENNSPFDCKFSSAEFESFVKPRSSRYG
jgi:hypothetical protein